MEKNSKIYVAGHKGMVGSALVKTLDNRGYTNLIVKTSRELDLRNQALVNDFFAAERPEYVFLAAARVGGILANSTYPADFIYDNLAIATNIIKAAHSGGVKKLLNLGSSCIYPKLAPQPLKEEYLLNGALEPTNEPYAVAKIAAIKLCRYYNEQYGTNFISVMPTNLYGAGDNFNLETGHAFPALLRKIYLGKLLNEERYDEIRADIEKTPLGFGISAQGIESEEDIKACLCRIGIDTTSICLWGSGKPCREFLYVDDLADAGLFLMERYDFKDIGEFINVGTGKDISIADLARTMAKVIGYKGDFVFDAGKPDGTPKKLLDVSRLSSLGWRASVSLTDGLKSQFDWYLSNLK